jgi:hypothetical protein
MTAPLDAKRKEEQMKKSRIGGGRWGKEPRRRKTY